MASFSFVATLATSLLVLLFGIILPALAYAHYQRLSNDDLLQATFPGVVADYAAAEESPFMFTVKLPPDMLPGSMTLADWTFSAITTTSNHTTQSHSLSMLTDIKPLPSHDHVYLAGFENAELMEMRQEPKPMYLQAKVNSPWGQSQAIAIPLALDLSAAAMKRAQTLTLPHVCFTTFPYTPMPVVAQHKAEAVYYRCIVNDTMWITYSLANAGVAIPALQTTSANPLSLLTQLQDSGVISLSYDTVTDMIQDACFFWSKHLNALEPQTQQIQFCPVNVAPYFTAHRDGVMEEVLPQGTRGQRMEDKYKIGENLDTRMGDIRFFFVDERTAAQIAMPASGINVWSATQNTRIGKAGNEGLSVVIVAQRLLTQPRVLVKLHLHRALGQLLGLGPCTLQSCMMSPSITSRTLTKVTAPVQRALERLYQARN